MTVRRQPVIEREGVRTRVSQNGRPMGGYNEPPAAAQNNLCCSMKSHARI